VTDGGAAQEAQTGVPPGAPAPAATPPEQGAPFNPWLLLVLVAIALAVSVQNWWLRRRAEGKPLLPDFLSRRAR
jgi:hypothetical protein